MNTSREIQTTTLRVEGMDCPDEIAVLRECLDGMEGINDLSFNLMRAAMTVQHDSSRAKSEQIIQRVSETGMRATVAEPGHDAAVITTNLPSGPLLMSGIAGVSTVAGAVLSYLPAGQFHHTTWPAAVCYLIAIGAGWRFVLPQGSIRNRASPA